MAFPVACHRTMTLFRLLLACCLLCWSSLPVGTCRMDRLTVETAGGGKGRRFAVVLRQHPELIREQQLNMKTDLLAGMFGTIALSGRIPVESRYVFLVKNDTWWEVEGARLPTEGSWYPGYLGRVEERMGDYFDLESLALDLPTGLAPWSHWYAATQGKLDLVIRADRPDANTPCVSGYNISMDGNGLDLIASELLCVPLDVTYQELAYIMSNSSFETVALDYFDQHTHNAFVPNAEHDAFRFAPELVEQALDFIDFAFPEGFVAVHWRRGDRNFRWDGNGLAGMLETALSDPDQLITFLRQVLDQTGLPAVFLATNSGVESELQRVKESLGVPVIMQDRPTNWRRRPHIAGLDMVIASRADHFVMSPAVRGSYQAVSTYSRRIMLERIRTLGFQGDHYSVCCGDEPALAVISPIPLVTNNNQFLNVMVCTLNAPEEARPWLTINEFGLERALDDAGMHYPIRSGRVLAEDEESPMGGIWTIPLQMAPHLVGFLGFHFSLRMPNGEHVRHCDVTVTVPFVDGTGWNLNSGMPP